MVNDEQGYASSSRDEPRPTMVQDVPPSYLPQAVPVDILTGPMTLERAQSCFAAGTPVRTRDGSRPIEAISVGDQVLTQDPGTGRLAYQPVVAVYHNRPAQTLRIDVGGESIVATPIHRFWKAGRGWVMARDLGRGDTIRSLGGLAWVEGIATDRVQPVFNLEVAGGRSFFVGSAGFLVHDNSVVEPVHRPFDAPRPWCQPGRVPPAEGSGSTDHRRAYVRPRIPRGTACRPQEGPGNRPMQRWQRDGSFEGVTPPRRSRYPRPTPRPRATPRASRMR